MNKPIKRSEISLSRRQVMIGAAGLSFAFALGGAEAAVLGTETSGNGLGPWISISLGGLLAIAIALFGIYLGQVRIYTEADVERLEATNGLVGKLVLGGRLLYKRQITTMLLDLALACLSLSAAYLLRYEGVLEKRFIEQFAQVLPFIVIFKLPLLYFFGVYRSMWRYTALNDQVLLIQKEMMRLQPGFRFVRGTEVTPAPEYVPMLCDPWSAFDGHRWATIVVPPVSK